MADDEKRVPDNLEEREPDDLTPDSYERSVPADLAGFRGISPVALVAGITLMAAIVIVGLIGFFASHTSTVNSPPPVAVATNAQPAAPGIGNPGTGASTPFIPAVTPYPTTTGGAGNAFAFGTPKPGVRATPMPIYTSRPSTPPPPPPATAQTRPQQYPPMAANPQPVQNGDDKMQLEAAPNAGSSEPENAQAQTDLASSGASRGVEYVPVYSNGRVVAVVPVAKHGQEARTIENVDPRSYPNGVVPLAGSYDSTRSSGESGAAQTSVAQAPPAEGNTQIGSTAGAQFASRTTTAQDLSTVPANQQTKYVQDQESQNVGYAQPVSKYQLDVTTVINARLVSRIVSDLPGNVIAQVTTPVYDSSTHSTIVVPAGTKLFGTYDNAVIANQTRLLMAFQRLVFPDGREFVIGGLPGTDAGGGSGFDGDVDKHRGQLYTSAFLLTVLGSAEAALTPSTSSVLSGPTVTQQTQAAAGAQLQQLGDRIINQSLQRPPTITIRPPYQFQVIVVRDLPLDKYLFQK